MGGAELAFWVDKVQELASMERLKEIHVQPIFDNQVSSDKDPLSPTVQSNSTHMSNCCFPLVESA